MAKRYEKRRTVKEQEIKQSTDKAVQVSAIIALVACALINAIYTTPENSEPVPWYIFIGLLTIAGGKEAIQFAVSRLPGGKS